MMKGIGTIKKGRKNTYGSLNIILFSLQNGSFAYENQREIKFYYRNQVDDKFCLLIALPPL